jgi:hypothetical protein
LSEAAERVGATRPPGGSERQRGSATRHPALRLLAIRLVLSGLTVEMLSLALLHHPAGFLGFLIGGCALLAAGFVAYVISVLRQMDRSSEVPE